MVDSNLASYVAVISNGSLSPCDEMIGEANDKLIYKLILEFTTDKRTVSTKFVKRLINKVRMFYPVIHSKTQFNRYELKQKVENNILILEYYQGELKDRFAKDAQD